MARLLVNGKESCPSQGSCLRQSYSSRVKAAISSYLSKAICQWPPKSMAKVCPDIADEPQEDPDDGEVLPEAASSPTQRSTSTIIIIHS
jgi:hypothetical protein